MYLEREKARVSGGRAKSESERESKADFTLSEGQGSISPLWDHDPQRNQELDA